MCPLNLAVLTLILFDCQVRSDPQSNPSYSEYNKILFPKCCDWGQLVGKKKTCKSSRFTGNFSDLKFFNKDLSLVNTPVGDVFRFSHDTEGKLYDNKFNKSVVNYNLMVNHQYYLHTDGKLTLIKPNEIDWTSENKLDEYCVDYYTLNEAISRPTLHFWSKSKEPVHVKSRNNDDPFIEAGLITSCVFLLLVLIVYCLLPQLRNLSGLVLMAYVLSLFGAFLSLIVMQIFRDPFTRMECKGLSYVIYFWFLATFCWMNVMSCDIWWTFRGYAKARPIHRRGEYFKFGMYCLYGFGVPTAMTVMFGVLDNINLRHIPWFMIPNIPNNGCFIGESAKLRYLYAPMLILINCNWIFFLMTAFNIWRLHRVTAVLESEAAGTPAAHRKQLYRFLIYLKLSVLMGISWIMEVVSAFYPDTKIWYITDLYNVFMGLSLFVIFVCKKSVFKKLQKRFRGWNDSLQLSSSSKGRISQTSDSEISQDTPQVCPNPKGPILPLSNIKPHPNGLQQY